MSLSVTKLHPPRPSTSLHSSSSSSSSLSTLSSSPLPPALIALTLNYICPPSQLSQLPPHLISTSLLQRHHFLQISPDDPVSYLTWPSDSDSHISAIRFLESFQKPIDDVLYSTFPVSYSADADSTYAHVAISPDHSPGLRLVFQWNSPDGWKYHNLSLMPFPPGTFDNVSDALLFRSHVPVTMNVPDDDDDDDNSYWHAYGADNPDDDFTQFNAAKSDNSLGNTEDAYWAQYTEVHGSGDSTLPSPLPLKEKPISPERVIVAYAGSNPSSVYNPLEPPSPNTLARRLEDLSPRFPSSSLVSNALDPASTTLSTQNSSIASDSLSLHENDTDAPLTFKLAGTTSHNTESYDALKDVIRSVYRLWRTGRPPCSRVEDEKEFLEVVQQVVAEVVGHSQA